MYIYVCVLWGLLDNNKYTFRIEWIMFFCTSEIFNALI